MTQDAFDLGERINNTTLRYKVSAELWERFSVSPNFDISFNKWNSIKYLNNDTTGFHSDIVQVPNDKGGLYLFYAKCTIISGITEYPFYIGRAQLTNNQSLRKRVKSYFQKFSKNNERPKIHRMFKYWSEVLYLAYLPLDDNEEIIDLEKQLINSLLFPMNDEIPDKEVKDAVKAFS